MVDRGRELRLGDLVGVEPEEPNGNGRQAAGTAEDPLHVRRDQAEVPLGLLIRLVGLTFLGYVVLTLLVAGYFWNRSDNQRFDDQRAYARQLAVQNANLTRKLNQSRVDQDRKIQRAVADLCANAELRDTVITNQSRSIAALLGQVPDPTKAIVDLIDASQDAISTLEPKGEKDCPLPPEQP